VIHAGNPDLVAAFDYFHFARPIVPPSLAGADLTNPITVPDSALLTFLGANVSAGNAVRRRATRH
jgi:hypothetical protein